ncbi:MAG: serine protease [Candidatus Moraniibacteriota bacterium]|nr:MAG: serine protease [Candidatus Moranbacteria bacterium]
MKTNKPWLIIITGLPGTGKTTIGRKLSHDLHIPFMSKDDFKEILFDTLGCKDRAWSQQLGEVSYDLLYKVTEDMLCAGSSLIIETNFNPKRASKKIMQLQNTIGFNIFQLRFFADGHILFERFKNRALSGNRHKGHCDAENLDNFKDSLLCGTIDKLTVQGEFLDVDTTDFEKVDYQKIVNIMRGTVHGMQ